MRTYSLIKTWTTGGLSSNLSLAEVEAESKDEAIAQLQFYCPAKMDESGYVKVGGDTYVVAERFRGLP